jgi:hypothetical protein
MSGSAFEATAPGCCHLPLIALILVRTNNRFASHSLLPDTIANERREVVDANAFRSALSPVLFMGEFFALDFR